MAEEEMKPLLLGTGVVRARSVEAWGRWYGSIESIYTCLELHLQQ